MDATVAEIAAKYHLKRHNGRFSGPCPKCGGKATSDRFSIRDDGGFKCYACDFKGDLITWLREMDGMSCGAAHQAAGKPCTLTSCPARSRCRMGDSNARRPRQAVLTVPRGRRRPELPTARVTSPGGRWLAWANSLVESGIRRIGSEEAVLSWLDGRGIDRSSVARFGLGWQGRNGKVARERIGLELKEDGKQHLWVPSGLVIPIRDDLGVLHRVRIRRTAEARARFLPELKYVWIEGSGTRPLVIRPQGDPRGAVIVEAELDAMACAAAHEQVLVVALGTVRAGIPDDLRAELGRLPVILVALDADPGQDGKPGPGPRAIEAWTTAFRQARFWPVPEGKDPGHYAELGGDLRAWIEAGLPPVVQASGAGHDKNLFAVCGQRRGTGPEDTGSGESAPMVAEILLDNGRRIHVTNDRAAWKDLAAAGKVVFSENELKRLRNACAGLDEDEAAIMKERVLEAKEVFGAAYIRRGAA